MLWHAKDFSFIVVCSADNASNPRYIHPDFRDISDTNLDVLVKINFNELIEGWLGIFFADKQ